MNFLHMVYVGSFHRRTFVRAHMSSSRRHQGLKRGRPTRQWRNALKTERRRYRQATQLETFAVCRTDVELAIPCSGDPIQEREREVHDPNTISHGLKY
jgi:hypothetical protein